MTTGAITSADRAAAGYMCCLVDCIADLWKRVYDYACALLACLFGDTPNHTCELPPSLVGIVADYAFDLQNYKEFIQLERTVNVYDDSYHLRFKMRNLTRELAAIKWLADTFAHPPLLKKIESLFLTCYKIDGSIKHRVGGLNVSSVYTGLICLSTAEEAVSPLIRQWQMSQEEAEQAWYLWTGFKKVDCLANALAVNYPPNEPIPPDGTVLETRTPLPQRISLLIPEGTVDLITIRRYNPSEPVVILPAS